MGLNGFLFNFVAQGWMITMTAIGGLVLLLAWAIGSLKPAVQPRVNKANFSRFVIAVVVNPIGLFLLDLVSDSQHQAIFGALITISSISVNFVFLLLSQRGLKGREDTASKFLRRGTSLLLIGASIAVLGLLAGVPGEVETWKN